VGTYAITAGGAAASDYAIGYAVGTLTVTRATPHVAVTDAGGTYTGSPFPAAATVAGVIPGLDATPAATLEGVGLTLTYFAGTSATGTPLPGAPSAVGTYTALASFAGSADYAAASATVTFTIQVTTLVNGATSQAATRGIVIKVVDYQLVQVDSVTGATALALVVGGSVDGNVIHINERVGPHLLDVHIEAFGSGLEFHQA